MIMYLTVSKPRLPFGTLAYNIDRVFDEMFTGRPMVESEVGWVPRADVHEQDHAFVVQLDLPGVEKDNVKVKFEDNTLVVSGERKYESTTDEKSFHRVERIYGSFTRSISVPKDIDSEKISASFKNGVLEITLPKTNEVKPKEIEIKVS
jgi:HSP20 family protein